MAEVRLIDISKNFADISAVSHLSLTIADAEFIVLLGPTGAGKTTTLRLIAGLEKPDAGQVEINGANVMDYAPAERDVCFIFQQYSLYPHFSVYDNMAFPLRAPGRGLDESAIAQKVKEVAQMLHIEHKLENRATQLSGGEMQRVAIGRALVRSPAIFLMDEPLSSLDARLRDELRVELKHIQSDLGATILYVTHDQMEAMTLADRIAVLDEGKLVQVGTPREVYETPANIYVSQRLGSPQINLLPADVLNLKDFPPATDRVGVRPEDILLNQSEGVAASVLNVEHLGVETVVQLQIDDYQIRCLLDVGEKVSEGDKTCVQVRREAVIYFDKKGELI